MHVFLWNRKYSSQSGDGLISVNLSVCAEFEVHGVPLEVVVMLDVNISMDNWLSNVKEEEHWNEWEHKSGKVTGDSNVDHTISFVRAPCVPISVRAWLSTEGDLLLSEALDVLVDMAFKLWLDFVSLNHLNHLLLLFIGSAISSSNLGQTNVDIVLKTFTHFVF